jgi:protein involved in polysaccharide export with SLBB domain
MIDPKDSAMVFVDVTAYNSTNYYVEGEAASPGRFPYTGNETVLDVIHNAGGLLPSANQSDDTPEKAARAPKRTLREEPGPGPR